ncbi:MAG: hypothetical protein IJY90_03175 [Clostridia bacterium]|nr:hypothetical protein [Clostridia bacterium]
MKFYYPTWNKENQTLTAVDGAVLKLHEAKEVLPSAMYMRVKDEYKSHFVDHFGVQRSKNYEFATFYEDSGFAKISKPGDKPRYLDIFLRESDSPTYSGAAAYGLFALLYEKDSLRVTHEFLISELEDINYSFFEDEVFYQGMIKMLVKYLRDEVQYAYENNLEQDCEQVIRETLQKIKDVCCAKRKAALKDVEKRNSVTLRRKNAYEHGMKLLDNFKINGEREDERAMVCVNEDEAEEYDKYDDDPYYI